MKKFVIGCLAFIGLGFGTIFAQNSNILPDSIEISVKDTIIEGEATNITFTIMKNGEKMTNYTGTIYFTIEEDDGSPLKNNEYTLPSDSFYRFSPEDIGKKEFQKGLEIKKEGIFYITVEDFNDPDEKILGRQPITVIKNASPSGNYHIDVDSPEQDAIITNGKLDIIATITELPNSSALIYIDNDPAVTVKVDSSGIIYHSIPNIEGGNHTMKIEIVDAIAGTVLGTSDIINFSSIENNTVSIKDVTVSPEKLLMVGDKTNITVYTDEMVESVKMKLSDRPDNDGIILTKDGVGEFSYNLYLVATGEVNITLETSTANNTKTQTHENVKQFFVNESPEIANITTDKDEEKQTVTISREILNGDPVSSYSIKYRGVGTGTEISGEEQTEKQSFTFRDVPYDTEINLNITPIRKNSLNLQTHGAASKTIQFIIRKPNEDPLCGNGKIDEGEDCNNCAIDMGDKCPNAPKCVVQNIATRTTKIGDNYYLIRDKVDNVKKYIVYSSSSPDGYNKIKVYETSDTSYEYPFDHTAEEEQFLYFWIVGICDDGEELELSGATKVQVGPAENFFLLMCLTFLIYFGIKLFRETEV